MANQFNTNKVLEGALSYLGTPYKMGAKQGDTCIDCSGLVYQAYKNAGVVLPQGSFNQFTKGTEVEKGKLQAGDMVFFKYPTNDVNRKNLPVNHIGIYDGKGNIVEASSSKGKVVVRKFNENEKAYVGAKRITAESKVDFNIANAYNISSKSMNQDNSKSAFGLILDDPKGKWAEPTVMSQFYKNDGQEYQDNLKEQFELQKQKDLETYNSTFVERVESIAGILADTSVSKGVGRLFDKTLIDFGSFGEKDDNYIDGSTYDYKINKLEEYGIEPTPQNIELLDDAINLESEDYILAGINSKKLSREFIEEHLTQAEIKTAGVTGEIGIQAGLLWRVGGLVATTKTITNSKLLAGTVGVGTNYALEKTIQYGDRDVSDLEVGVYTAIGGIADTLGGIMHSNSLANRALGDTHPEVYSAVKKEEELKQKISNSINKIDELTEDELILREMDNVNLDRTYKVEKADDIVDKYTPPTLDDAVREMADLNTFDELDDLARNHPDIAEVVSKAKSIKKEQVIGATEEEQLFKTNVNKIDVDIKNTISNLKVTIKEFGSLPKQTDEILDTYVTAHGKGAMSSFDEYLDYFRKTPEKSSKVLKDLFAKEKELDNILASGKYTQSQITKVMNGISKTKSIVETQYGKLVEQLDNKELYERLADNSNKLLKDLDEQLNSKYILDMDDTTRANSLKSLGDELSSIFGKKIKVVEGNGAIKIQGNIVLKVENGKVMVNNKPLKVGVALALVGTTGAMADDGSNITASDLGLYAIAILATIYGGKAGIKAIQEHGFSGTGRIFSKKMKALVRATENEMTPEVKAMSSARRGLLSFFKFKELSFFYNVEKNGAKSSFDLLKKLLPDPAGGNKGVNAYIIKMQHQEADQAIFNQAYKENYSLFRQEAKQLGLDSSEETFNKAHADMVERPKTFLQSPYANFQSVKNMEASVTNLNNKILDDAVQADVEGTKDLKKLDRYRTRAYFEDTVRNLFIGKNKDKFVKAMSKLINGKKIQDIDMYNMGINDVRLVSGQEAEELMEAYLNRLVHSADDNFSKDIFNTASEEFLKKYIKTFNITDEGKITELEKMIMSNSVSSRFKYRMEFDFDNWEDFTILDDLGEIKTVTIDDIFNRNQRELLTQYSANLRGRMALKLADTSELEINNIIKQEPSEEIINNLKTIRNIILGEPVVQNSNLYANSAIDVARNLVSSRVLLTSTLSTLPEVTLSVYNMLRFKTGISYWTDQLTRVLALTKDSREEIEQLALHGAGLSGHNLHIMPKNGDFLIENMANGWASKYSRKILEKVLRIGRLTHSDDFMKRTALHYGYYNLNRIIKGEKNVFTPQQMEKWGVTQERLDLLKKNNLFIEKNGRTIISKERFNKLPLKEKAQINQMLHDVINGYSPYVTPSSISKFFINNPAGKLVGSLLSFSLSIYNSWFIGALKYGDKSTAMEMSLYFAGAMASTWARNELFGHRDLTEEELITRSIMQMPMMGGIGAYMGVTDPIVFQTADKAQTKAMNVISELGSMVNNEGVKDND